MSALIEELMASPTLPETVSRLHAVLAGEKQRRAKFYEEITPDMKAEFAIKGFRAPLAAFFDDKANLAALRKLLD